MGIGPALVVKVPAVVSPEQRRRCINGITVPPRCEAATGFNDGVQPARGV
jgi:hypothetical protein